MNSCSIITNKYSLESEFRILISIFILFIFINKLIIIFDFSHFGFQKESNSVLFQFINSNISWVYFLDFWFVLNSIHQLGRWAWDILISSFIVVKSSFSIIILISVISLILIGLLLIVVTSIVLWFSILIVSLISIISVIYPFILVLITVFSLTSSFRSFSLFVSTLNISYTTSSVGSLIILSISIILIWKRTLRFIFRILAIVIISSIFVLLFYNILVFAHIIFLINFKIYILNLCYFSILMRL